VRRKAQFLLGYELSRQVETKSKAIILGLIFKEVIPMLRGALLVERTNFVPRGTESGLISKAPSVKKKIFFLVSEGKSEAVNFKAASSSPSTSTALRASSLLKRKARSSEKFTRSDEISSFSLGYTQAIRNYVGCLHACCGIYNYCHVFCFFPS